MFPLNIPFDLSVGQPEETETIFSLPASLDQPFT